MISSGPAMLRSWIFAVCLGLVKSFSPSAPQLLHPSTPKLLSSAPGLRSGWSLGSKALQTHGCFGFRLADPRSSCHLGVLGLEASGVAEGRIMSYNVLSSSLCEPDYHCHCKPEDLDERARLERLKTKLKAEVAKESIICLQELSTKWAGDLHVFFSESGYHLIHMGYGSKFDGFMGCAIAFPLSKYQLQTCEITRVADLKKWPPSPRPGFRKRIANWIAAKIRAIKKQRRPTDPIFDAKRRRNQMVMTRLRDKASGVEFCVATYHMPCQFRLPEVMVTHTALAMQGLQSSAKSDPLIFCGDFNFKPEDSPYKLVTEGLISPEDKYYPKLLPNDRWEPKVKYAMQSAYQKAEGADPKFTNWAYTKGSQSDFVGCLDYIFMSPGVSVKTVDKIDVENLQGPFPIEAEPSDHLMIAGEFEFRDKGNTGWQEVEAVESAPSATLAT